MLCYYCEDSKTYFLEELSKKFYYIDYSDNERNLYFERILIESNTSKIEDYLIYTKVFRDKSRAIIFNINPSYICF